MVVKFGYFSLDIYSKDTKMMATKALRSRFIYRSMVHGCCQLMPMYFLGKKESFMDIV